MSDQHIKIPRSLAAYRVWEMLDNAQRETIQKNYPFRLERNAEIRRLKSRGVQIRILVELTGISRSHILRIIKRSKNSESGLFILKKELANIQESANRMEQHLANVQMEQGKGVTKKEANTIKGEQRRQHD